MFVDPTRGRSQGFALAAVGVLALGACNDPEQNTDLRPDGPPDVLAVLVMNDAAGHLVESATYCKPNDEKRPGNVGLPDFTARDICPADRSKGADEVTNAYPDDWYVRIVFDELLDPNIEELTEILDPDSGEGTDTFEGSIANTHPVKLECESIGGGFVEVEYDGYYSPAGNAVTWPLGPSLVIKPNDPTEIATGKACRVTLNDNITDKSGNKVPDAQRTTPYTFKLAPIQVVLIDPPDDPDGEAPIDAWQVFSDNIYVQFNTAVDETSYCDDGMNMDECEFGFTPDIGACSTGGEPCEVQKNGSDCPTAGDTCDSGGFYGYSLAPFGFTEQEAGFGPNFPVQVNKSYTFSFLAGKKVKDRCGVETTFPAPDAGDMSLIHYKTKPFALKTIAPGAGDLASPMKKLNITFTNMMDATSLDANEYTLSPPLSGALPPDNNAGNDLFFAGDYALDTTYTFTLKAGAKLLDVYGAETTITADRTITWKTQPAVTMTSSPADMGTVTKATPASSVGVTLTFNQSMTAASLVAGTDYTFVDSNNAAVTATVSVGSAPNGCSVGSTGCQLRVRGVLNPGTYTFTLKANAQITGVLGATFTQPTDKVIHFTVKNADPTPPHVCL